MQGSVGFWVPGLDIATVPLVVCEVDIAFFFGVGWAVCVCVSIHVFTASPPGTIGDFDLVHMSANMFLKENLYYCLLFST